MKTSDDLKKAKVVCSGNMKGGVGKSQSTMLMALELSLRFHKKTIVLDCDEQATIYKTRAMDAKLKPGWDAPYEIEKIKLHNVIAKIRELKAQNKYDYIIIDMPRITEDMDNASISFDIVQLLGVIDVLFIPIIANTVDLESTQTFLEYVHDVKAWKEKMNYPFIYIGFQNRYEKAIENKMIPTWAKHFELPMMKSVLKKNNLISRHYSTYFSTMSKPGGKELLQSFIDEVYEILNK